MSTDDFNEKEYLLTELQWRQMRFREAQAELQKRMHDINEINQAIIHYLEGTHDDHDTESV